MTLNLFFIVALIAGVTGLTGYILMTFTDLSVDDVTSPYAWMIFTYVVCIVTAISTTFMIRAVILNPMIKMGEAMERLAQGDFSVRLEKIEGEFRPVELNRFKEAFNTAAEELGSVEMLRKDFVHNFSHEFKTPIVSINGFADMLLNYDLPEEEQKEYLELIRSESRRLAELSDHIQQMCRLEHREILTDKTEFSLVEQIRQDIILVQQKWKEKEPVISLEINPEEETFLYNGEENLLTEVWLNLMDNAVKFSDEGENVAITLRKESGEGTAPGGMAKYIISIVDHGEGMEEETLSYMFDQFYQGDSSHAKEGNGLGLSMVKKIITLHGGKISVESKKGSGSCFMVDLPVY